MIKYENMAIRESEKGLRYCIDIFGESIVKKVWICTYLSEYPEYNTDEYINYNLDHEESELYYFKNLGKFCFRRFIIEFTNGNIVKFTDSLEDVVACKLDKESFNE